MTQDASPPTPEVVRCDVSGGFPSWLSRAGGSLAVTTYQARKVVLVGWDGRRVSVLSRDFDKPMGLAVDGPRLALATRYEIIELTNAPALAYEFIEGETGRYDALYLPRVSHHTGELNVHDLAYGDDGLWMVNTRFSCLSLPSRDHNFHPQWRPSFVSDLVPEDRCHLNGLAMDGGRPRFVSALGETDRPGGWREFKATGGVVIDVETRAIVLRGLCMPHSPRLHAGALWLLNSGAGELWRVDPATFEHEVVCALPGYLRGLCLVGDHALIGMSTIREQHIFGGLPVQERHPRLRCGVAVVDLRTGALAGEFLFTEGCTELFEVRFLPGVVRPMIVNTINPQSRQAVTAPGLNYWLRPGALMPDPS